MWGTASPGDELTGDFGNRLEAVSIGDRGLFRLLAGNLLHGIFGLLQHNRSKADIGDVQRDVRLVPKQTLGGVAE